MDDALIAAVLIGAPLALAGVLGLAGSTAGVTGEVAPRKRSAKRRAVAPAFARRAPYSPV